MKHPMPYKLQWLNNSGEVKVAKQELVTFSIGKYRDKVLCDVVSMHVGHLLLGRPWQYDRMVQHDRFQNRHSFLMEGRVITLAPLSPREAHEDQLKIKRESVQSSRDGRIAYCSIHVPFRRKFVEKISKPFHDDRTNIQGRILVKRRGMMRSRSSFTKYRVLGAMKGDLRGDFGLKMTKQTIYRIQLIGSS